MQIPNFSIFRLSIDREVKHTIIDLYYNHDVIEEVACRFAGLRKVQESRLSFPRKSGKKWIWPGSSPSYDPLSFRR